MSNWRSTLATNSDIKTDIEANTEPSGLALSTKQLHLVRQLLRQNLPDHRAWAFGSRVTGHSRKYSDLDIAVSHSQALPFLRLCQLSIAFEESDLDICVDIVDWLQASPEFRKSVEQSGMVRLQ